MLPKQYTLFANSSLYGTPAVRALWYEFPNEPELFGVDRQYLVGRDILVTPVLTPNVSSVDGKNLVLAQTFDHHVSLTNICTGIFPGEGRIIWRDFWTHNVIDTTPGANTTLPAPLGSIPVHIRDGSALLLHSKPGYTITETRAGPYSLLVAQATDGYAFGDAYIDDGETAPPTPSRRLKFHSSRGVIKITSEGNFHVVQKLDTISVLGAGQPKEVVVQGKVVKTFSYAAAQQKLVITGLNVDLNREITVTWL